LIDTRQDSWLEGSPRRREKTMMIACSSSTAKEKYIAACDACIEVVWLRKLVFGLSDQVLNSTVIYSDDQSYVKLSENLVFHDRSKHIEIKHYILRDKVQRGEVVLQYISTDEQIGDILVKPLSKMKILRT
jgi:hypothetical protein